MSFGVHGKSISLGRQKHSINQANLLKLFGKTLIDGYSDFRVDTFDSVLGVDLCHSFV